MEQWKKVACKNQVGNLKTTNKKLKKKRKFRANVLWDWLIWEQVHTSFKQKYNSIAFRYVIDLSPHLFKCALSS